MKLKKTIQNYFCENCFQNDQLIQYIKTNGRKACEQFRCSVCSSNIDKESFIIDIDLLLPILEKGILNTYEYSEHYSDERHSYGNILDYRAGYIKSLEEIISDFLHFHDSEMLFSQLKKKDGLLSCVDDIESCNFRDLCAYGIDLEIGNWDSFCEHTKHKARYFNHINYDFNISNFLEKFKDFFVHMTIKKEDVIYRAREIKSKQVFLEIESNPAQELGKAPVCRVENNRFSPIGISYGYFSFDKDTALTEIRAMKHTEKAIGGFKLDHSKKLIDLRKKSIKKYFNPFLDTFDFRFYCSLEFIGLFTTHISKKVSAKDSLLEYVPTQIISEYIWSLEYDGFIFDSSQKEDGENIVIFGENPKFIEYTLKR